jgi:hypothetical protein
MVYDIDTHELNLKSFTDLKFLNEISFNKCIFWSFLNNECIIIFFFLNHYHIKEEEIL